jgi:hypothetical protein
MIAIGNLTLKQNIMRLKLITALFLWGTLSVSGQEFLEYTIQIWGEYITSYFVVDGQGNMYLTGSFEGPVYAGSEDNLLTPLDSTDSFIMKVDSSGNLIWDLLLTGAGSEFIMDFDVDEEGNCYFQGNFDQALKFDTVDVDVGYHGEDFLARLDKDGKLGAMRMDTVNGRYTGLRGIALNTKGKLCVAGLHNGTAPFGEENPEYPAGEYNFICLMDEQFNISWNISVSGSILAASPDQIGNIQAVVPDLEDNILFTGMITDSLVMPDTIIVVPDSVKTAGNRYQYFGKLDAEGKLVWIRTYECGEGGSIHSVFVDGDNNAWFVGEFMSIFPDELPGSGTAANIIKFNEEGEYLWSRSLDLRFTAYVVDSKGFLYGSYFYRDQGYENGFVIIDPDGNMVYDQVFEDMEILELSIGTEDEIYYHGTFSDEIFIDDEQLSLQGGKNGLMGRVKTDEMLAAGISGPVRQEAGSWFYPNPAAGRIILNPDRAGQVSAYEVYSMTGRLVRSGIPQGDLIELNGLEAGVYMIRVRTGKGLFSGKIIIY